ncbi:hypothetical protein RCC89_09300 [Cytophagaceae bacterium ABcell3]|nr:hypothetical protein RCC89_09300 [Cytophagaceae bacterium ABcell3]
MELKVIEVKRTLGFIIFGYFKKIYLISFFIISGILFFFDHLDGAIYFKINLSIILVLLVLVFVIKEYKEVGKLTFDEKFVYLDHLNTKLSFKDLSSFNFFIEGYRGQMKIVGTRIFISNGANNYIRFELRNSQKLKFYFLLESKDDFNKCQIEKLKLIRKINS